jgi:hypothetical protein
MSLSVYFSHSRPSIQLNWNDLFHVSSYFFLQSTVFVSSFIFHFLPGMASLIFQKHFEFSNSTFNFRNVSI